MMWRERLFAFVSQRASRDRINKRGSRRPQEGLQYLCARALQARWVVPPRDLDALHQGLVELGVARMFAGRLELWHPAPWLETETLAQQIRELLGPACAREDAVSLETF